jgi:hypothetical protein
MRSRRCSPALTTSSNRRYLAATAHGSLWHEADKSRSIANVRFRGYSGHHSVMTLRLPKTRRRHATRMVWQPGFV